MSDIQTSTFKGARYVPKFKDPINWVQSESYEAITVVQHNAFTYLSKQPVPAGVDILNETYWLRWADPNAQMEELRQIFMDYVDDVEELSGDVADVETAIARVMPKLGATKKAVIYGDSTMVDMTEGQRTSYYIAEETGMDITNRAISGTSLFGNANAFYERITNATSADFEGFDFIFIAYGTNDWQSSHQLESYGTNTVSFKKRLAQSVARLNAIAPGIKIVFITPAYGRRPMVGNSGNTIINYNFVGATLENYVNAILDFCYQNKIACVDLWHTFNINENNYEQFMVTSETLDHPEYEGVFVHYKERTKQIIGEIFANQYPYYSPATPIKQHGSTILGIPYFIDKTKLGNNTQINNLYGTLSAWNADKISVFNDIHFVANSQNSYIETIPFMFTDEMTLSLFNAGSTSILVYIDNTLFCELCYSATCAIYVRGYEGLHKIKFVQNANTSGGCNLVNVQMFDGITDFAFEKCANGSGLPWHGLSADELGDAIANSNLFFVNANANEINILVNGATVLKDIPAITKIVDMPSFVADEQYYFSGGIYRAGTGWMPAEFFVGYNTGRTSCYLACFQAIQNGDKIYCSCTHENSAGCVVNHAFVLNG